MLASLYPVRDMRLSGQVIHTGRSSLEIAVRMEALGDGTEQTVMLGKPPLPGSPLRSSHCPKVGSAWYAGTHGRMAPLP